MSSKILREWKKVFESDLGYIAYELKDLIEKPSVIILEGPMGVGKTTFTKQFIQDGETLSPSYSVLSETKSVLHADFYRLENKDEIIHIELPMYLENKQYFVVEWGEKYLRTLYRETPEGFHFYKLSLSINENHVEDDQNPETFSRNFVLSEYTDFE